MKQIIKETGTIYNEKRTNLSNNMLGRNQLQEQSQIIVKTYKTKTASKKFLMLFNLSIYV